MVARKNAVPLIGAVRQFLSSLAILITLGGCWLPHRPNVKPAILWHNYGEEDGLSSKGLPRSRSAVRPRDFSPTPIGGGLGCQNLCIVRDGALITILASTEDQLLYSPGLDDPWSVAMDGPPPSGQFTHVSHPTLDSAGRIWAVTAKGVWRSFDNGGSWERVFDQSHENTTFVDLFARGSTIWVASRDDGHLVRIDADSGAYSEWQATTDLLWRVCEAADGRLYITSAAGVSVSANGGASFQVLHAYANNDASRTQIAELDGTIWALVAGELMQLTSDGTLAWSSSAHGLVGIDAFAAHNGVIWALGWRDGPQEIIYRIDTALGNQVETLDPGFTSGGTIAVDDQGRLYVSYPGAIAMSDDEGATWQLKDLALNGVARIAGSGSRIWAVIYGGRIARWQPEGDHWEPLGYLGWVNDITILFCPSEEVAFFGFVDTLHFTLDGGATTMSVSPGIEHSAFTGICGSPDGTLYAAVCAPYGVPVTGDSTIHLIRGRIGSSSESELVYQGRVIPRFPDVEVDPHSGNILVSSAIGLFARHVSSSTWQRTSFHSPCFDIEVSPTGTVYMLAQNSDHEYWNKMSIYRKDGENWSWVERSVPGAHCDSRIAIDGDGHIWVTSMAGLKLSTDSGLTWFSYTMGDGLASDFTHCLYVEGNGASKQIWVGTAMGASRGTLE